MDKREKTKEELEAFENAETSKIILKTSLTTAFVFLLVIVFVFCITALISPGFISDASLKLGATKISSKFAVGQYERTKDIDDLAIAVERSINSKSYNNVAKYGEILIDFKDKNGDSIFKRFCEYKDDLLNDYYLKNKINLQSDYHVFICGNYVYALYKTNQKAKAYDVAIKETNETNYVINNTISKYIDAYIADSKRDATNLPSILKTMYNKLNVYIKNENYCAMNIALDLNRLYSVLIENQEAEYWKAEFDKYNDMFK